jgi:hypothetical protein
VNQELINILKEENLLPKENIWLSCFKAAIIPFLGWFYIHILCINNHGIILGYLGVKDDFIGVLVLIIPFFLAFFILKDYLSQSYFISVVYYKQIFTVYSLLYFIFISIYWVFKNIFNETNVIFLTTVVTLFQAFLWKNEIKNKLKGIK